MKSVSWNAINLELPDEWELLQFSKSSVSGRIAFADRYQFRFELDWSTVTAPPDLDRMASDYKAKLVEDGVEKTQLNVHLPWKGVQGLEKDNLISRYVNYYPSRSLMLETVFLWPEPNKYNHAFEGRILDSLSVAAYREDGQQHWQALNLDFKVNDAHYLKELIAEPANTVFTFRSVNKREVETIARRGLLEYWLKQPLQEWLKGQVPRDFKLIECSSHEEKGHLIWNVKAVKSPTVLVDWVHGTRTFWANAWICPKDNRLYTATKLAPAYRNGQSHEPLSLTCCNDLEVTL